MAYATKPERFIGIRDSDVKGLFQQGLSHIFPVKVCQFHLMSQTYLCYPFSHIFDSTKMKRAKDLGESRVETSLTN